MAGCGSVHGQTALSLSCACRACEPPGRLAGWLAGGWGSPSILVQHFSAGLGEFLADRVDLDTC